MKYGRTYNFSAGPAMMPEPVLEEIAAEMMNYRLSGMCVMEMSHRSGVFQQIRDEERPWMLCGNRRLVEKGYCGGEEIRRGENHCLFRRQELFLHSRLPGYGYSG